MELNHNLNRRTLLQDFLASVVVFLVALPLCLGIAIASGVPPAVGIISGIIGGIIVGFLAGCPLQVTGPAAGLVAVIVEITATQGYEKLGIIVLLAGIIQIIAGMLKWGQWFRAVTPAVIQGMLAGIGVLIFASQFHVMVDDTPKGNAIANILSIPMAVYKGLVPMDDTSHHLAATIGATTILIMLVWEQRPQFLKMIPAPLIAVLVTVIMSWFFNFPIKYVTIEGNLLTYFSLPQPNQLAWLLEQDIWIMALTIAFVASAETLLTASAVDLMQTRHSTNYNKEILAQGIGNTLCGFFGALPVTGVIVRSAANIQAGAQTRLATILHGIWLLCFVSFFPFVLERIPIASLAAILVYTGYKLINPKTIQKLWVFGRGEAIIYLITLIAIVTANLLEGVIIGIIATAIKLIYTFSHLEVHIVDSPDKPEIDVYLRGSGTFLCIPNLTTALENIPPGKTVHVHIDELEWLDHACLEILVNCEKQYNSKGGQMTLEWTQLAHRFLKYTASGPEKPQSIVETVRAGSKH